MNSSDCTPQRYSFVKMLEAIAPGPPLWPDDRFFHCDIPDRSARELTEEQRRIQLRVLLTDVHERDYWPTTWLTERLKVIAGELRARAGRRSR